MKPVLLPVYLAGLLSGGRKDEKGAGLPLGWFPGLNKRLLDVCQRLHRAAALFNLAPMTMLWDVVTGGIVNGFGPSDVGHAEDDLAEVPALFHHRVCCRCFRQWKGGIDQWCNIASRDQGHYGGFKFGDDGRFFGDRA